MDMQRAVADITGLPPLAWSTTVGVVADVPHDRPSNEEGEEKSNQAAQQRDPPGRDEVQLYRLVHGQNLRRAATIAGDIPSPSCRRVPIGWFGHEKLANDGQFAPSRLAAASTFHGRRRGTLPLGAVYPPAIPDRPRCLPDERTGLARRPTAVPRQRIVPHG